MGSMGSCDQELWIEDVVIGMDDVVSHHWVHVVNVETIVNLIALYTQVTAFVSDDNEVTNLLPLPRPVELLVDPSVETEGLSTDVATKLEVLEAVYERLNPSKFGVRPNRSSRLQHCPPTRVAAVPRMRAWS